MGQGRRAKLSELLRRTDLVVAIGVPLIVLTAAVYEPWSQGGPVICLFRRVTGAPCPGCGLTRSFCALVHGRLREALQFNLAGPAVLATMLLTWAGAILKFLGRGWLWRRVDRLTLPLLALLVIGWARALALFFGAGDGLGVMARENILARLLSWLG